MNNQDEDIRLDEVGPNNDTITTDGEELTLDDLGGNFVKNPKVGEYVVFEIKSILKNTKNLTPTNPKTGKQMKVGLTNVEYNIHVYTTDGKLYTISSWEIWGKLKAIWQKLAAESNSKNFLMTNQVVRVAHVKDGMRPENKNNDNYSVAVRRQDGKFYELERNSREWKALA